MKKLLLFISLFFIAFFAKSQINNDSLEYRIRPDEFKAGELALSINNFNFQRNYEFFNRFQDGYTLFGTQLEPQLVYYAHPRLVLTAGVHLRKDFGEDGLTKAFPLFSIKYKNENSTLINGVLEGNLEHRYIEPLYDFEKKILDPIEYGTQYIIQKPSFFFDAWINWKKMIYKPSPEQEQVLGGISSDIRLVKSGKFTLSTPIQFIAFHQGGQIDTLDVPLQTHFNSGLGVKIVYATNSKVLKAIRTENYLTNFLEYSFTEQLPFSKGYGIYLNAAMDTKYGSVITSYWRGNNFFANQGMPIYQSISQQINNPGYTQKNRELLVFRYTFQKELIPHLYMDFRFEPFIDLGSQSKAFNFHHSSFLVYRRQFSILKAK